MKILLIEDEPGIRDNIIFAFREEGFHTIVAQTGEEGLRKLRDEQFDLVVLDIGLPDISGIEVCKAIRKQSEVPLIFLTAKSSEIDRVLGLELGADDYITKPFSPRELIARIKTIIRRVSLAQSAAGDSAVPFFNDVDRRVIVFFGTPLSLSHYEYEILSLLLRRPGWVYTREMIIEKIWSTPGMISDRAVDAHMKALRKKLREVNSAEAIVTHRSVGYSLRESW